MKNSSRYLSDLGVRCPGLPLRTGVVWVSATSAGGQARGEAVHVELELKLELELEL